MQWGRALLCLGLLALSATQVLAIEKTLTAAIAVMSGTSATSTIAGVATFNKTANGILVTYNNICGFLPNEVYTHHVHVAGNIVDNNGAATLGHFNGSCATTPACRGVGILAEIGNLNNGVTVNSDANGCITTSFTDTFIKLNGVDSIIGRGLVFHLASSGARVAHGVIGRWNTVAEESAAANTADGPVISRAICALQPTASFANGFLDGFVSFQDRGTGSIEVRYFVYGLGDQLRYPVSIRQTGNIADTVAGSAAQDEFVGTCNNCRPNNFAAVGNLGGDNLRFITISNVAQGFFTDSVIRLNGTNSIVGRALQLFDPNNAAICVAQCTIGIDQPENTVYTNDPSGLGTVPQVVRAAAVIQPANPMNVTSNYKPPPPASEVDTEVVFRGISRYAVTSFLGSTGILPSGYVEFTMVPGTTTTAVRYFFSGLPPSSTHILRVHSNGDTCDTKGMSVGDTLAGSCSNCRPSLAGDQQLAGLVGNNIAVSANTYGVAKGYFVDSVITLNGANSILGRSIVVHGNGTSGDLSVIGMGVVGRLETHRTNVDEDLPTIYNAGCSFESTLDSSNTMIQGYASFALDSDGFVVTKIYVAGLTPGNHGFHVHTQGDVLDYWHALSVQGHFNTSNLTYPRPFGQLQEVGLLNDGTALVADAKGVAFTTFKDKNIALNGLNGIVGRSLVIHGNGTDTAIRVAQCVIGATRDTLNVAVPTCATLNDDLFPPSTTSAHCQLSPTVNNPDQTMSGWITFTNNWPSPGLFFSWSICGLEPGIHPFHVHHRGEIFSDDGTSTLDHFIGPCTNCRRYNPQEVGNVNSGMFPFYVGADGCTTGSNNDTLITLNGPNSILGRSIVIHGRVSTTNNVTFTSNSTRVAQCVIGRADSAVTEAAAPLAPRQPTIRRASCNLVTTANQPTPVKGFVTFEYANGQMVESSPVEIKYYIVGLDDGDYPVHVHQAGNISDSVSGLAVGGHYNGTCQYCRPVGVTQEVGYIGDGTKIKSRGGVASGFFTDSVIKLNGRRSIVGRSLIVHHPISGNRLLQCVIGLVDDGFYIAPRNYSQTITFDVDGQPVISPTSANPTVPTVTRAVAILTNTSQIEGKIAGYVEFELERVSNVYSVKYLITGLQPSTPRSWAIYTKGDLCQNDGTATGSSVRLLKTIQVDANGVAKGNFSDVNISFNDTTTVIGRSVIIYDNTNSVPIAQGVIGRAKEDNVTLIVDRTPVYTASCRPVATGQNPNPVDGYFLFQADDVYSVVRVWYTVWGLQPGKHRMFVHQYGDLTGTDSAGATGGYFVGNITISLPPTVPQVVGAMNNGSGIIASAGTSGEPFGYAQGSFFDFNLALSGPNSILGRSVVIYGDDWTGNPNARVAQCVIGLSNEVTSSNRTTCTSLSADDPPAATCYLTATKQNPASISSQFFGYVSITQVSGTLHRIEYQYCGLSDLNPHYFSIRNRGDISNSDGSAAGNFFGPCNNCRGHGATDYIGNMDQFTFTNNGSQYCGTGVFYDNQISLTGDSSVIARTLFIHGSDTSATAPVAQCVIGRNDYSSVDTVVPGYNVTRAIAVMIPTALAPSFGGGIVTFDYEGEALFQKPDGSGLKSYSNYGVRFFLYGLPLQAHTFHIHHKGNMLDPLGNGSEGHYFGKCNNCRPVGVEQAIGRLGNGYDMQAQNGVASGYMNDHIVALNGDDSIMGRAMIIHGDGRNLLPRVQQSVLGVLQDTKDAAPTAPPAGPIPQVTRAAAIITATANAKTVVLGNVEFLLIPGSANLAVTAMITGLESGVSHSWALVKTGDLCSSSGTQTVTSFLAINGGAKLNADVNGVAHASFQETTMRFYGVNSIIGRSIVVYGNLTTGGTGIIGQGVIGKIAESATVTQQDHPKVYTASCRLTPTFVISPAAQPIDIAGYVFITADNSTSGLTIQWQAINLPTGTHQWYVHQRGDVISADNGLATGATMAPLCGGDLLKVDDFGVATGKCTDPNLSLNGANSILGRSIVLWGDGTPIGTLKRVAQCVVGVVSESDTLPATCPLLDAIVRPSDDSGMSTATLAGIVVGSVVGGLVLIAAVAFLVKRRQSSETSPKYKTGDKLAPENAPVEMATAVYKTPSSTTPTAAAPALAMPSRPAPLPPQRNTTAPALPSGWEQHDDDEGNTYYYNTITKQSVWELPQA